MNKAKKRISLLVTLMCAFVLVLLLGIVSACGGSESANAGAWYYGAEIPASDLGQEGDYYLNTQTLKSYVKEGKAWREALAGEASEWYYGTEPIGNGDTIGHVGDFYLNTKSGDLYQKTAEGWGEPILSLKGEDGRSGVMWFSGDGDPEHVEGAIEGDFYLKKTDFTVWQYVTNEEGALEWVELGSIRGEDAKDPVHFFNGNGAPKDNAEKLKDAKEGNLYLGQFTGLDGKGAGSILYRKIGGEWVVLMESMESDKVINIYSHAQLLTFAEKLEENKGYEGMQIHLKTDIDFEKLQPVLARRGAMLIDAATGWTPIGTETQPFKGTFDGEGHTISNLSVATTSDAKAAGFFGYVENATIENLHFVGAKVEATGKDAVAGVVVGQAKTNVTVNNVTVDTAEVTAEENATAGSLVGKADALDAKDVTAEEGTPLVGSIPEGKLNGENVTVKGESGAKEIPCLTTGEHEYDPSTGACVYCGSNPFTEGGKYVKDGVITGYPAGATDVVIPGHIDGNPAQLSGTLFKGNKTVQSVTFGDGIESIPARAFQDCSSLKSAKIPSSVTEIGDHAFSMCAITEIELKEGLETLGTCAFWRCPIESIEIPASVKTIGASAFYNTLSASKLTSLTLHDGLQEIGASAFEDARLTKLEIPDSVTTIGAGAFNWNDKLEHVLIGTGITSAGGAFDYVTNTCVFECKEGAKTVDKLFSTLSKSFEVTTANRYNPETPTDHVMVVLPDSITKIADQAFYQRSQLISVTLPENVTTIGKWAFCKCTKLQNIVIPDSVTNIGADLSSNSPFDGCSALKWIVLPAGLEMFIGHYGSSETEHFKGCTAMKDIYFKGSREEWDAKDFAANIAQIEGITVHCNGDDWDGDVSKLLQA